MSCTLSPDHWGTGFPETKNIPSTNRCRNKDPKKRIPFAPDSIARSPCPYPADSLQSRASPLSGPGSCLPCSSSPARTGSAGVGLRREPRMALLRGCRPPPPGQHRAAPAPECTPSPPCPWAPSSRLSPGPTPALQSQDKLSLWKVPWAKLL